MEQRGFEVAHASGGRVSLRLALPGFASYQRRCIPCPASHPLFTLDGYSHRPALPVLPQGCVVCQHGEWRSEQLGLFDTIVDT